MDECYACLVERDALRAEVRRLSRWISALRAKFAEIRAVLDKYGDGLLDEDDVVRELDGILEADDGAS